jgi:hypothetical protein
LTETLRKPDQQEDGGDIDQFDPYDDVQFNPYVEEPWSQKLFRTALQTQGLEGMQLVTLSEERVSKECRDQALKIKQQVENMMLRGKFDDVTSAKEQKIRVPKSLPKLAKLPGKSRFAWHLYIPIRRHALLPFIKGMFISNPKTASEAGFPRTGDGLSRFPDCF